jgi:hypothetical protein
MSHLPSIRPGVLRQKLDDELLVYDPQDEQIHLLNATAAKVFDHLQAGHAESDISATLASGDSDANGAEMLAVALDELAIARLTEASPNVAANPAMAPTTRRAMVQRLIGVSAALVIPTIITLVPNTAQAASNLPNGSICVRSVECASGCCGGSSSGACTNNQCNPAANCPGKCAA